MALGLLLAAVGIWLRVLSPAILLVPVYIILLGMLAVGIGWIAAALQVYLRDTSQVLTVVLTAWFWLTPIFIFEDQLPARLRFVISLNPLAYVVRAYRQLLLSTQMPSAADTAVVAGFAAGIFVLGGLVFRHLKRGFADVL